MRQDVAALAGTLPARLGGFTVVRAGQGCRRGSAHLMVKAGTSRADRERVAAFLATIAAVGTWTHGTPGWLFDSCSVYGVTVPPGAFA